MATQTCGTCRWRESFDEFMGWATRTTPFDPDASLSCRYPAARMPLCMQGVAQREREQVAPDMTGCPCWEFPPPTLVSPEGS
jgi:hypothetical protein